MTNKNKSYDNLLKVPDFDTIGEIPVTDMDELLKVNKEMFDVDISKEDIDNLLNIETFYPAITVTDTGAMKYFLKILGHEILLIESDRSFGRVAKKVKTKVQIITVTSQEEIMIQKVQKLVVYL